MADVTNRRQQRAAQRQAAAAAASIEPQAFMPAQQQQHPDPWGAPSRPADGSYPPQHPLQQQPAPVPQFQQPQSAPVPQYQPQSSFDPQFQPQPGFGQQPQPAYGQQFQPQPAYGPPQPLPSFEPQYQQQPPFLQPGPPQQQPGPAAAQGSSWGVPPVSRPHISAASGVPYDSYAPPTSGRMTLLPAAAAAFRAEQGAPFSVPPPPAPSAAPSAAASQQHRHAGGAPAPAPHPAAVYEESIATGAFRRVGIADLAAMSKAWRRDGYAGAGSGDGGGGGSSGGDAAPGASATLDVERLDPSAFVAPRLPSTVRALQRSAQALIAGLLLGLAALVSQYSSDSALVVAWAVHANWARIAVFVLGVLAWLGAVERVVAVRRAAVSAASPSAALRVTASPPRESQFTLESSRPSVIAGVAYSVLLATVFATMPADQRITVAATALSTGTSPSGQLVSDIASWKALLAVRLACALVGWLAATWDVRGPQDLDILLGEERQWRRRHEAPRQLQAEVTGLAADGDGGGGGGAEPPLPAAAAPAGVGGAVLAPQGPAWAPPGR